MILVLKIACFGIYLIKTLQKKDVMFWRLHVQGLTLRKIYM